MLHGLRGYSFIKSREDSYTGRSKVEDLLRNMIHRPVPDGIPAPQYIQNPRPVVPPRMGVDGLSSSNAVYFLGAKGTSEYGLSQYLFQTLRVQSKLVSNQNP